MPDIAINLFWHAKVNRDPANMWTWPLFARIMLLTVLVVITMTWLVVAQLTKTI